MHDLESWMIMEPIDYLKKLEKNGHSCFIVGGYVRDTLMGLSSSDIDIATSARPSDIVKIFKNTTKDSLGSLKILDSKYTIDVTTYRSEAQYDKRHPKSIEYLDNVEDDLQRRDFTINAICMDSKGNIFDPFDGRKDLETKVIRVIGNIASKFEDDPLRILRAFRLSILYGFTIEKEAMNFIAKNLHLLERLSYDRRREELDKILVSKNAIEGLRFLNQVGAFEPLGIVMPPVYHEVEDLVGAWAQIDAPNYRFSKVEKMRIENVRSIIDIGQINVATLYHYGIYDNTIAGEILGIDKCHILRIYEQMPIHSIEELAIDGNDIMDILNVREGPIIKRIKKDLIEQVLSGNLLNSESELSNYIRKNWK